MPSRSPRPNSPPISKIGRRHAARRTMMRLRSGARFGGAAYRPPRAGDEQSVWLQLSVILSADRRARRLASGKTSLRRRLKRRTLELCIRDIKAWLREATMTRTPFSLALTAVAAIVLGGPALAAPEKNLGKVHFSTSCTPAAQKLFDVAMTYQHSFWYRTSKQAFEDTLKADPTCAIAYWGIGLSLLNNPFTFPPAKNLPDGLAALEKGKAAGAKTPRENDLINALAVFYTDHDKLDHRTRVQAYFKAMDEVAQRHGAD